MDIRIKTTDYELAQEVRTYLDDKIASIEKLLGNEAGTARCEVELGRAAGRPRHGANMWFAEMRIVVPGEDDIYARNNSSTVNAAIDDVKEEAERQLRKGKKLHIRMIRRTGAAVKRWMRLVTPPEEGA